MTEAILNWFADTMARTDIIDLYFIVSDLIDIPLSEAELCQTAFYDSMAMYTVENAGTYNGIPLGKLVL